MKSIERLKSDYIRECSLKGISSIPEIRENLRKDISSIKVKLQDMDPLRIELRNLQKIDEKLTSLMQTEKIISDFDDDTDEMKEIRSGIISIIEDNEPLSNSEIILKFIEKDSEAVGQDAKIIRCIKWLAERGYIEKSSDRKIIPSEKWSELHG